eukprot:m.29634 g.29634  ORF g.29634 m.29634 type:complete len:337 (+) comp8121_c0_seq1:202-1212(+)
MTAVTAREQDWYPAFAGQTAAAIENNERKGCTNTTILGIQADTGKNPATRGEWVALQEDIQEGIAAGNVKATWSNLEFRLVSVTKAELIIKESSRESRVVIASCPSQHFNTVMQLAQGKEYVDATFGREDDLAGKVMKGSGHAPQPVVSLEKSVSQMSMNPATEGKSVSYDDHDGDNVSYTVENGQLIQRVNGQKRLGNDSTTGIVTQLHFKPPRCIRDQFFGGGHAPKRLLKDIAKLADSVNVPHNIVYDGCTIKFDDGDGDHIKFSLEGGELIQYVNGKRMLGNGSTTGKISHLQFYPPRTIRDQYGGGGLVPARLLDDIKIMAETAGVQHNIP